MKKQSSKQGHSVEACNRAKIIMALCLAYTDKSNSGKGIDVDLVNAQADEILKILPRVKETK